MKEGRVISGSKVAIPSINTCVAYRHRDCHCYKRKMLNSFSSDQAEMKHVARRVSVYEATTINGSKYVS